MATVRATAHGVTTASITPAGSDAAGIAFVLGEGATSGVTWGGAAMTAVGSPHSAGYFGITIATYRLEGIGTGSAVNVTASGTGRQYVYAVALDGANQTNCVAASGTGTDGGFPYTATPSVSVTAVVGELLLAFGSFAPGAGTPTPDHTDVLTRTDGYNSDHQSIQSKTAASTSESLGWTITAAECGMVALAIAEPAGSTAFTLTADPGAFSIVGTDAALLFGRTLTAESGAFTITGTDASFIRTVFASAGAFDIVGVDATLRYGRVVTAESGTFTATGTDATLAAGRVLAADPGAFAITGTDANLVHTTPGAFVLTATGGTFSISGTDAGVRYGRSVVAESGAFTIAGTGATFLLGRVLAATGGVFAITGTAATLDYSAAVPPTPSFVAAPGARTLTATPGARSLVGTPIRRT